MCSALVPRRLGFVPVVLDVGFSRFCGVVGGVVRVAIRRVRVVSGRLVVACFMMLCRFAMVVCRMLVMLRGLHMMLSCLL